MRYPSLTNVFIVDLTDTEGLSKDSYGCYDTGDITGFNDLQETMEFKGWGC